MYFSNENHHRSKLENTQKQKQAQKKYVWKQYSNGIYIDNWTKVSISDLLLKRTRLFWTLCNFMS